MSIVNRFIRSTTSVAEYLRVIASKALSSEFTTMFKRQFGKSFFYP